MKKAKFLYGTLFTVLLSISALTGCNKKNGEDTYDKNGRLILNVKNISFENWKGEDSYTEVINEKFGVKIKPSGYSYKDWDQNVLTAVSGNNLTDVIHFNLKAYNFGSTYEKWASKFKMLKPLPDNMSKWPNLKTMLDHVSNIDALKIDGKLYGIPIANDIDNPQKDFSNMTFVYRRDWAKKIDEMNKNTAGYTPVYKENDVYTWEEFDRLTKAFAANIKTLSESNKASVLVDESWGFPSITNFFKDVPHCYTKDESGKVINAFTCDKYIEGLETAKDFVNRGIYPQDQYTYTENAANEQYLGGLAAIMYDNLSISNYIKLRRLFKKYQKTVDLDDGTAFLKIKGPDGKFAIEGIENWFAMTMFNGNISDNKLEKILDILDYLLSKEGTRLAIYGIEGYDYMMNGDEVILSEQGWEKGSDGNYVTKDNGAKYLRYMATLGNDTKPFDPYTEKDSYEIVANWQNEMQAAKEAGQLRVVQEPADIDWMSTPTKNDKTQALLTNANTNVLNYSFNIIKSIDAYKAKFDEQINWGRVLNEINEKLGK